MYVCMFFIFFLLVLYLEMYLLCLYSYNHLYSLNFCYFNVLIFTIIEVFILNQLNIHFLKTILTYCLHMFQARVLHVRYEVFYILISWTNSIISSSFSCFIEFTCIQIIKKKYKSKKKKDVVTHGGKYYDPLQL